MTQLLQNALYGGALILAAALLRRLLKDRLSPEARLALWAACLFRLLTPIAPTSALSLWGLARLAAPEAQPAPAPGTLASAPANIVPASPALSPSPAPAISPTPTAVPFPWETVLLALWLAVGAVLAVRYVLSWLRTRRAVAAAVPLGRDDPRYASLPPFARLREGPMEGAPLTFGAVKPTVVLSPGLEGEALECVLAHEGVHAARRDNLWHYAMALALAVHWWNPAVWLMARLLRRDIELSCDRAAVRRLGAGQRAAYANTLVSLSTQAEGPAFCQSFGRKATEERVRSIMKFKKTSVIGMILSLSLVLAVTVAFASSPKGPDPALEVDGVTLTGDAAKYALQLRAGMTRDEVHQLLGEPHSMLSGMYGDVYILEHIGDPLAEPAYNAPAFYIYYSPGQAGYGGGDSAVGQVTYRAGDGRYVKLIQYFTGESGVYRQSPGCDWAPVSLSELDGVLPVIEDQNGSPIDPSRYDGTSADSAPAIIPSTITFPEYAASLEPYVAAGKITQEEVDWNLDLFIQGWNRVQMGEADCFSYNAFDGNQWVHAYYFSDRMPAAYPRNSKGETYGSSALSDYYGASPDLALAIGTKGEEGYIREGDVPGANVKNPEEAMAYMEWLESQPEDILIPLYDCEGNVIGQFAVSGGRSISYPSSPAEEIAGDPITCPPEAIDAAFPNTGYQLSAPACGVEGCTLSGDHSHENGEVIHHYDTLPAKLDSLCSVDGCTETRHHTHTGGHCFLLSDPCPVEGCTVTGEHLHNGVSYSCNGAGHHDGHCDGSCYTYNEPAIAPSAPPTAPTGHHSKSHHGKGHH